MGFYMSDEDNLCAMCNGTKMLGNSDCPYCNGTGEWTQAAESYMKHHICQCINWDRAFCPVCHQRCHHDTTNNPKQTISPGPGGMKTSKRRVEEIHA